VCRHLTALVHSAVAMVQQPRLNLFHFYLIL
jgi:hypothetical protein